MLIKKPPYRVGVIGLGYAQRVHLPLLQELDTCFVTALCGTDEKKTKSIADKYGVPSAYDSWERMLTKENLDMLTLAVPPNLQSVILRHAFSKNIFCFCEKPLAANVKDAKYLVDVAGSSANQHAVDFIFPEIPLWQEVNSQLVAGIIGAVKNVLINWHVHTYASRVGEHPWKLNRSLGGGVLMSFVSHVIYYVEWMFGRIERVICSLHESVAGEDSRALIRFDLFNGVSVTLSVSQDSVAANEHSLSIFGETGMIRLENRTRDYVNGFEAIHILDGGGETEISCDKLDSVLKDGRLLTTGRILNRWVEALIKGDSIKPNISDGARVQSILGSLEMAARQKSILVTL